MKVGMLRKCFSAVLSLGMILLSEAGAEDPAAVLAGGMTLREKVGQLFMIRPDALEGRFGPAELEDNSITGTTEVTVQFVPYGFPAGAGLSGVAALLWLAILIFEKKASGNDPEAATQQAHQEYTHAVIPDKESADKG